MKPVLPADGARAPVLLRGDEEDISVSHRAIEEPRARSHRARTRVARGHAG